MIKKNVWKKNFSVKYNNEFHNEVIYLYNKSRDKVGWEMENIFMKNA